MLAPELGQSINESVLAKSIAARAATLHGTERPSVNFPIFSEGTLDATSFTAELGTLPLGNASTDSVNVVAYKIAGASQVSSEELQDISEMASYIGQGLADQIVWKLDAAFLSYTNTDGFAGLQNKAYQYVDTDGAPTVDHVIEAVFKINGAGGINAPKANTLILPVATAKLWSEQKTFSSTAVGDPADVFRTDSTQLVNPLVIDGATIPGLEGINVIVSDLVSVAQHDSIATDFWLLDSRLQRLVLRTGTQVVKTYVPQNDSWFLSATSRWGFDTLNANSIVRGYNHA